jgi:hypothetical protein
MMVMIKLLFIGWALTTLLLIKWIIQYFYEEFKKNKK